MMPDTDVQPAQAGFSDLDLALADWARRHGATPVVAKAFALANRAVTQGHSCQPLDCIPAALVDAAAASQLPGELAASALVGQPGAARPLIVDDGRLYLQRYHVYESQLAQRLAARMTQPPEPVAIEQLQPGAGLFEAGPAGQTNWQAMAAFVALRHRFAVISGGPGTGKTHTIVRLLRVLIETALQAGDTPPLVALAAPTGKASARMLASVRTGLAAMAGDPGYDPAVESHVPERAYTLHRLLGLHGNTTRPHFHADNPLAHDVVIVDEASMVGLPLMAKLADALPDHARLILLGDRYQLASVESGSVLAEICAHAGVNQFSTAQQQAAEGLLAGNSPTATHALADHVVTLQTSRRFNSESAIGRLAAAVNTGDAETAAQLLASEDTALDYHAGVDATAMNALMDGLAGAHVALCDCSDPATALATLAGQCVLTAVRHGPTGSTTVNAGVTARLARRQGFNPAATWYHGRPVMVTQNDYRAGLFNGDLGVTLTNNNGHLRVYFDGEDGPRAFLPTALPAHETAYAMTIHKSQGSEFDAVTLVLPDYDVPVVTRELAYTGLTRARERLTVYATPRVLTQAIARRVTRWSGLATRLPE